MRALILLAAMQVRGALRRARRDPKQWLGIAVLLFSVWLCWPRPSGEVLGLAIGLASIRESAARYPQAATSGVFLVLALFAAAAVDSGANESFLVFAPADIDFVFPSPVSRRLLLAIKLPAMTLVAASSAIVMFTIFGNILGPSHIRFLPLVACAATYFNLGLAWRVILGPRTIFRRIISVFALLLIISVVAICWRMHLAGLTLLGSNSALRLVFYPCYLASHMGPGESSLTLLAAFYGASLILLFARPGNFTEDALVVSERAMQFAVIRREQGLSAAGDALAARYALKPRRSALFMPGPGAGATALAWAQIAAMRKRPALHFGIPIFAGVLDGGLVAVSGEMRWFICILISGYILLFLGVGNVTEFKRSLNREDIVRPLPLEGWQVAAAEAAARMVVFELFLVSFAAACLVLRPQELRPAVLAALLPVPLIILMFTLFQFGMVHIYRERHNRLQQWLGSLVANLTGTVLLGVTGGISAFPLPLHLPPALLYAWICLVFGSASALLICVCGVIYDRAPMANRGRIAGTSSAPAR